MDPPKLGWPDAPRKKLPPWDRVIDVVYHKYRRDQERPDPCHAFGDSIAVFFADSGRVQEKCSSSPYLKLPANIRFKICQKVVMEHSSELTVSLDHKRSMKEVWKSDDFISLSKALEPLSPYMAVSFGLRADIMVAFLMTERFHVTYSPFVNTYFDPLATLWCNRYGHFMQEIVLELDMTRLAFGPGQSAHKLRTGTTNIDKFVKSFVEKQLKRCSPLKSLVLLCRRFYGQRPVIQSPTEPPKTPGRDSCDQFEPVEPNPMWAVQKANPSLYYCPDEELTVCEPLVQLKGMIDSMRLTGLSDQYTHYLLRRVFQIPADKTVLKQHSYRVAPSTVWPRLPGQSSWIDSGNGKLKLDDHTREYLRGLYSPEGAIQLPPPYFDPVTGIASIREPSEHMDVSTEWSVLYERPESRMTMVGRRATNTSADDVNDAEKGLPGLANKIRRSMSKRGFDTRQVLDQSFVDVASPDRSSFGRASTYSGGSRRSLKGLFKLEGDEARRSPEKQLDQEGKN
ncbi:alpha beta hydrolase fold protein [Colletotrichum sojae]|uniref:Alpha beta hydrolase fold protein n=1 Tax=Colletotrichum sojae TaxID=2175907 RepID=A0A8H6J089_9PEZI|nr:alpha beta hydrolase fold protein [Colletotrichum sojae]